MVPEVWEQIRGVPQGTERRTSTKFREGISGQCNIEDSAGAIELREKTETSHREGGSGAGMWTFLLF